LPAQTDVGPAGRRDQEGRQRRDRGDGELQPGVEPQGIQLAVGTFAEHGIADSQAAHEDRHHGGRGGRGAAEEQLELPELDDLINQSTGPGTHQEQSDEGKLKTPHIKPMDDRRCRDV
jgi:hypothetical protein